MRLRPAAVADGPLRGARTRYGVTDEAHDWSYGREGFPLYCTHCTFMNESLPIRWIGYPLYPSDPPDDFDRDPCTWYWYKDPADIPDRHWERYGLDREHAASVDAGSDGPAGRRVIVTGAAGGIGRAIIAALAAADCRVAACDADGAGADAVPGATSSADFDVRDRAAVTPGVAAAVTALGGCDAVVANAGVVDTIHRAERFSEDEWRMDLETNLTAPSTSSRLRSSRSRRPATAASC